jgi:hypothetical protein
MDWIADRQAFAAAYAGQLRQARSLSRQAIELAKQQGDRERAAVFAVRGALWEAFFGNAGEAKQAATSALGLARNREVSYGAAVALALAGDTRQAEKLAADLERNYLEDTSVRFSYLPVIRAILDLRRSDPVKAVESLEIASPYELGTPRSACTGYFGSLYPILIRGEAYLAARKGVEAAREFQKVIDHRGIMIGDPVSSLAHYGLARSYVLSGEAAKAHEQFKLALDTWKDANSDLQILREVKARYANLQ